MDEETPLQDEIDTMRCNLKHLVETFSTVETLKACPERSRRKHFKLSSAINYTTASLTRLVRAQQILREHQPDTFMQGVRQSIAEVLKERGRI